MNTVTKIIVWGVILRFALIVALPMYCNTDEIAHLDYVYQMFGGNFPTWSGHQYAYPEAVDLSSNHPDVKYDKLYDETHQWQRFQPPLYYLVTGTLLHGTFLMEYGESGFNYTARLFGLIWFVIAAICIAEITRKLFDETTAMMAVGLFAFVPGFMASWIAVTNDGLTVMLSAIALLTAVKKQWYWSGVWSGLAVWSKLFAGGMVAMIGLYLLFRDWRSTWKYCITLVPLIIGWCAYHWLYQFQGGTMIEQSHWSSWGVALKNLPYTWDTFFAGLGYHFKTAVFPFTAFYACLFVIAIYSLIMTKWYDRRFAWATVFGFLALFGATAFNHFYMGMGYGRYMYPILPAMLPLVGRGLCGYQRLIGWLFGIGLVFVVFTIFVSRYYWGLVH